MGLYTKLVNGEPGELICHQRGLQQGDPLSPMLFILVMDVLNSSLFFANDVLNSLIMKASEQGLLQPILARGGGQRILLYADEVVLFPKPCTTDLALVKEILRIFGEASGLVTNIRK